ncbi:replication protein A 70 kDa DNA-binding subunit C-like [Selaginella moellendorffii]|uniref:replication protein A 70 kDa DNA-binding subunit C-like n=1 Tax=Selaginella moellendorffii TaxID=88036 RepID=UPI000D1C62A8|nr:replication protein A 70 kDa DNA-binding subunit C-like [Selaginella moellendorffii]|eukprot:XP_024530438.1 replication protein A 70 kDa DNA-binding subunit C-like [Selaginella moellendorffii]
MGTFIDGGNDSIEYIPNLSTSEASSQKNIWSVSRDCKVVSTVQDDGTEAKVIDVYNLDVPIGDPMNTKCNVDWTNISPKDSGAFVRRRMLSLSDESGHSIDMCLWDSKAEDEGSEIKEKNGQEERPIVCMKGSWISDYNGKSISVTGGSNLLLDPELEGVSWLCEWMVASYNTTIFVHVTNSFSKAVITKTVSEMLSINLKVSEFSAIFCVIVSVKEFQTGDFYYPACMKVVNGRQCGKKVTQVSESMWQCNSCDTDSGDIHFKCALHLCILDSTGHIWAVSFDDANEIVEMPACKLAALQDDDYTVF